MNLTHSPHPVLPQQERKQYNINKEFQWTDDTTIADVLLALQVNLHGMPTTLTVNGKVVDIDDWETYKVKPGDELVLRATVHGGNGGSNPMVFILSIALVIAAPWAATAMGFAAGTFAAQAVAFGIVLVGSLIISAIFSPTLPGPNKGNDNPSPTYALSGGSNNSRPFEIVPFLMGVHRVFPDYDSRPYTEFEGEDQYLYQTFNFGIIADDLTVGDIRIGENPISNFSDVEIEISIGKTGELNSFPTNVDTQSGGELDDNTGWIQRTTSEGTYKIGLDVEGILFKVSDTGEIEGLSVDIGAEWRIHPSGAWQPFFTTNSTTISNGSQKPVRKTYTKSVGGGQYDVRIRKLTGDFTSDRKQCELQCSAIRSYQRDTADYTGQKRMAIKVKASGQLNGVLQTVNAICSQYIPTWNGSSWSSAASSNPAWQYYRLAKGVYDPDGNLLVGLGLSDSEIDLDQIKLWGAWCSTHGLGCNYIYDSQMVCADLLAIPARIGRGSWSWGTGKLGIVWDQEDLPITQLITMENIVNQSYRIEYVTAELADEIVMSFINPDLDWKQDTVRVVVPGVTDPVNPVNIDVPGITSKVQAGQEANMIAARQAYHKKRVILNMDSEGLVSGRGDVVALSHDLTSWGQSSRVSSGPTTTQLVLQTPVTFQTGETHYCAVRYPDGNIYVRQVNLQTGERTTITLTQPLPTTINNDIYNKPEDYLVMFDIKTTPGKRMKIVQVKPLGQAAEEVQLELINDDPDYYDAEGNGYDYIDPGTYHNNIPTVYDVSITEDILDVTTKHTRINVSWRLIAAKGAMLRVQAYGEPWVDYGNIMGTSFSFDMFKATTITIELTPIPLTANATPGNKVTQQYTIIGVGSLPPGTPIVVPNVSGLELQDGTGANGTIFSIKDPTFTWRSVSVGNSYELGEEPYGGDSGVVDPYFLDFEIEIYVNDTKIFTDHTLNTYYTFWWSDNALTSGGPHREFTIKVYQRSTLNTRSLIPAVLKVNNPSPDAVDLTLTSGIEQYWAEWTDSPALDLAGYIVCQGDTNDFTPSINNIKYKGLGNACVINETTLDEVFVKVAPYDVFGDDPDDLNWSSVDNVTTNPAADIEEIGFEGITFTPNDPNPNYVSWTSGTAYDKNDGTTWSVAAGNALWTTGVLYVYYIRGAAVLTTSTNLGDAVAGSILASYRGGTALVTGTNGSAYIDGGMLLAQTVGANQLVANTAIITNTAQLANAVVGEAKIADLAVSNAKVANQIYSSNWNPTTKTGWMLDKTTGIQGNAITIYNATGQVAFQSGTITAQAGLGAYAFLNQINGVNISTYIAAAAIDTLFIKGQAVTFSVASYTAAGGTIGATETAIQTCSITCSGAPVQVLCSFIGNVNVPDAYANVETQVKITRQIGTGAETALRDWAKGPGGYGYQKNGMSYTLPILDNPGAGNITYKLWVKRTASVYSGACSWSSAFIGLMETKK